MKLSELEHLVQRMRVMSRELGNRDPNVEFFILAVGSNYLSQGVFANMEPEPGVADVLNQHVVVQTGEAAKRGDFAIPLRNC